MKTTTVQPNVWGIHQPDMNRNAHVWTGLTLGKLRAIYEALLIAKTNDKLSAVGVDCMRVIQNYLNIE